MEPQEWLQRITETAQEIMQLADRHTKNGRLTVNELKTYLRGTTYEPFADWISQRGHLSKHDGDHDGVLDIDELGSAISDFYI